MKSLGITTLLVALCVAPASAASLSVDQVGNVFSLYLNGLGFNGQFNAVSAEIIPAAPAAFGSINMGLNGIIPRSAGEPLTFRSRWLDAPVVDGGQGWSILGITVAPNLVKFDGGPLGQVIDTSAQPGGRLFLANVVLPYGSTATANVLLAGNGLTLAQLSTTFATGNVPEPATLMLAGLSMGGLFILRRQRA
jgi:hypothetical protein